MSAGVFGWVTMTGQTLTLILGSLAVVMDSWWQAEPGYHELGQDHPKTGLWYPCRRKCGSVILIRLCMCVQLVPSTAASCAMVAFCTQLLPKHNRTLLKTATNCLLVQVALVGLSLILAWKTQTNFGSAFTLAWGSQCVGLTSLVMMCMLYKDAVLSSPFSSSEIFHGSPSDYTAPHVDANQHRPSAPVQSHLCANQGDPTCHQMTSLHLTHAESFT